VLATQKSINRWWWSCGQRGSVERNMPKVIRTKVIVAGDPAVGKTALVQMFSSSGAKFPKTYQMTCGVEFCSKQVAIPDTDVSVELHIFDTGGQDLFTEMLPSLWQVCLTPRAAAPSTWVAASDI